MRLLLWMAMSFMVCWAVLSNAADHASVHLVIPVKSPFKVQFQVKGYAVDKAGSNKANTGHHHILIDHDPYPKGRVIPNDATNLHFGKGQTEAELTLSPRSEPYRITLQFANGLHESFGPEMSETLYVLVQE